MSIAPSRLAVGLHRQVLRQAKERAQHPLLTQSTAGTIKAYQRLGSLLFRDTDGDWWFLAHRADWRMFVGIIDKYDRTMGLNIEISHHAITRFFDGHPERASDRAITDEFRPLFRLLAERVWNWRMATLTGEARVQQEPDGKIVITTWIGDRSVMRLQP